MEANAAKVCACDIVIRPVNIVNDKNDSFELEIKIIFNILDMNESNRFAFEIIM